jgi:hypothetical protein
MWLAPVLLVVISIALVRAGLNQKTTQESGVLVTADVVDVNIRNRADVTYGHVDLRFPTSAGDSTEVRLPLPLSLLMSIEGEETVAVRLLEDAEQPVLIDSIAHAQWRMSFIHASMSLLGAILLSWGIYAWNRFLKEEGDPGSGPHSSP